MLQRWQICLEVKPQAKLQLDLKNGQSPLIPTTMNLSLKTRPLCTT